MHPNIIIIWDLITISLLLSCSNERIEGLCIQFRDIAEARLTRLLSWFLLTEVKTEVFNMCETSQHLSWMRCPYEGNTGLIEPLSSDTLSFT